MRAWLPLLILLFAGCTQPNPSDDPPDEIDDPCSPGYTLGCDDNPDAQYMLDTYGLHQFTNSSYRVWGSNIDSGLVTWVQGGFGDPVTNHALVVQQGRYGSFAAPQGYASHPPNAHSCCIAYGLTPIKNLGEENQDGDYKNSTLWLWDVNSDEHRQIFPDIEGTYLTTDTGGSFEGEWILVYDQPPDPYRQQEGWAAVHAQTGVTRILYEGGRPNDESQYGGPLIERVVGDGHAYLSMYYEYPGNQVANAVIDVDLTTGERREILNVSHSILHMDASDDYLVMNAAFNGESGAWLWNHANQAWLRVGDGGIWPRVGGDWVVYLEPETTSTGRDALVGFHVPSLTRHVLVEEVDGELLDWDTDGAYAVVKFEAFDHRPTELVNSDAQLYWMELPSAA